VRVKTPSTNHHWTRLHEKEVKRGGVLPGNPNTPEREVVLLMPRGIATHPSAPNTPQNNTNSIAKQCAKHKLDYHSANLLWARCFIKWTRSYALFSGHDRMLCSVDTIVCFVQWTRSYALFSGHDRMLCSVGTIVCSVKWTRSYALLSGHDRMLYKVDTVVCSIQSGRDRMVFKADTSGHDRMSHRKVCVIAWVAPCQVWIKCGRWGLDGDR
jgi:hypothetical protein